MQRNDLCVNREFVCEEDDEANLQALAAKGDVAELVMYLLQMNPEKIAAFFANPTKTKPFIKKFPSKEIAVDFTTVVLNSRKLMPLVPVAFYTLVSVTFEKRQSYNLFSPQPVRHVSNARGRLTRSFSSGK